MEQLWFTHVLNAALGGPMGALLSRLGMHTSDAAAPFSNAVAMEILVALILVVFATWISRNLSVDKPGAWQHVVEVAWTGIYDHAEEVAGHGGGKFINFLFTLAMFILISNLIGMIPGFQSPTAEISTTLGLAVMAFLYYQAAGIRKHGAGYVKQFLGPVAFLAPLMLVIEVFGHFARILSLSVRLYANMMAGEVITTIFVALVPVAGIVFMGLHVFVALLQTYIFMVLTMVYLGGAIADEH